MVPSKLLNSILSATGHEILWENEGWWLSNQLSFQSDCSAFMSVLETKLIKFWMECGSASVTLKSTSFLIGVLLDFFQTALKATDNAPSYLLEEIRWFFWVAPCRPAVVVLTVCLWGWPCCSEGSGLLFPSALSLQPTASHPPSAEDLVPSPCLCRGSMSPGKNTYDMERPWSDQM